MQQALEKFFGFTSFRDGQQQVIERILAGEDLCVVMPTGAGKSLCYQLPALMRPGYTLVVSPLISLMKDQVDALHRRGVEAACINSTIANAEQQQILNAAATGTLKLLYVAPERFRMPRFRIMLEHVPPSLLVIDEAHCISQWGHDFRPDYLRLGEVVANSSIDQICAFTATATPQVRSDICNSLHRPQMHVYATGFERPNLSFKIRQCQGKSDKLEALGQLLADPKPTIIYTSTRKAVDEVAAELDCTPYHAGMSDQDRATAQETFMRASCPVLVATNAFGMGIDRADIRRVIHYNLPGSLEAYYQEAGRAGRDGEPADCLLLFSYADRFVHEFLIDLANPSEMVLRQVYAALRRYTAEHADNALELTAADLVATVPAAKNEKQVGAALRVLDKHGYVTRHYRRENLGCLQIDGDLQNLRLVHQHQSTQRSRFLYRIIASFGDALQAGVKLGYEQLAAAAGLHVDQVQRVVRALQQDKLLQWTPPFSGRAMELCQPDAETLEMDFAALTAKRRFDESRLEDMIAYTRTTKCRQLFFVSYFGQKLESWQCGCCDICASSQRNVPTRKPSGSENMIVRAILDTVQAMKGRFGRTRVCQVLAGAANAELQRWRLDELAAYGQLQHLRQNELRQFMAALESAGCIDQVGNPEYPCVGITPLGVEVLAGRQSIALSLPPARPQRRGADSGGTDTAAAPAMAEIGQPDSDLLEILRQLRSRMAQKMAVPPFQIMHDRSLRELAAAAPVTPEEALTLYGIGKRKAVTVLPAFLEAIAQWRSESLPLP